MKHEVERSVYRKLEPAQMPQNDQHAARAEAVAVPQETTTTRQQIEDDVIDAEAASKILKIHPVTVRLKAAAGEIPGRQVGNRWRFSRQRLHAWIQAA